MIKMKEATAAVRTSQNTNNRRSNISYKAVVRSGIIRTPIPGLNLLFFLATLIFLFTLAPFIIEPKIAPSPFRNTNHNNNYARATTNATSLSSKPKLRAKTLLSSKKTFSSTTTNSVSSSTSSEGINLDTSVPFIHIVNTRFQQHVYNLAALGAARLELFETFCLPTMIHQTIQQQTTKARKFNHVNNLNSTTSTNSYYYRFIWIIKIDPNLDIAFKNRMIHLLKAYPNFFLVGSNNNFAASYGKGISRGSWRSGHAGDDVLYGNASITTTTSSTKNHHHHGQNSAKFQQQSSLYTGDIELLRVAHALRNDKIILETRLDADDGLPLHYLEKIQKNAIENLFSSSDNTNITDNIKPENNRTHHNINNNLTPKMKKKWMYWCMTESLLWYPTVMLNGFESTHIRPSTIDVGGFTEEINYNHICLTPGLTSGISVGVNDSDVPRYSHANLLKGLIPKVNKEKKDSRSSNTKHTFQKHNNNCAATTTDDDSNGERQRTTCLQLINGDKGMSSGAVAIRARTPTSAGMSNVVLPPKVKLLNFQNNNSYSFLKHRYGIEDERAVQANHHFYTNLIEILKDNLNGQCTHGHSCKKESKKMLIAMIKYSSHKRRQNYVHQ